MRTARTESVPFVKRLTPPTKGEMQQDLINAIANFLVGLFLLTNNVMLFIYMITHW